jgi:hypothetical protein
MKINTFAIEYKNDTEHLLRYHQMNMILQA